MRNVGRLFKKGHFKTAETKGMTRNWDAAVPDTDDVDCDESGTTLFSLNKSGCQPGCHGESGQTWSLANGKLAMPLLGQGNEQGNPSRQRVTKVVASGGRCPRTRKSPMLTNGARQRRRRDEGNFLSLQGLSTRSAAGGT
uniref:Uncharacterized protein n=1 Tax=Trichuris muris TaxID=70415 RepID=A0A5S6QQN8_TRIMR